MRKATSTIIATLVAILFTVAVSATPASAQARAGPQLSFGDDAELGIGVRGAVFDLEDAEGASNWEGIGSIDYFFPGGGVDYWEVNMNGAYNVALGPDVPLFPYVGAGLNVARTSVDGGPSDTDLGLNVLGGWKYRGDVSYTPFAEVRLELGGGDQLVVTGGFLIP